MRANLNTIYESSYNLILNIAVHLDFKQRFFLACCDHKLFDLLRPTFVFHALITAIAAEKRNYQKTLPDSPSLLDQDDIEGRLFEFNIRINTLLSYIDLNEKRLREGNYNLASTLSEAIEEKAKEDEKLREPLQLQKVLKSLKCKNVAVALRNAANSFDSVDTQSFKLLLKYIDDINSTSTNGNTALHWAVKSNNRTFAEILVTNKAQTCLHNKEGSTPLHLAANKENDTFIKILIPTMDFFDAVDNKLQTPLHIAAKNKRFSCVKALVAAGANPHLEDVENNTPLSWLEKCGRQDIVSHSL